MNKLRYVFKRRAWSRVGVAAIAALFAALPMGFAALRSGVARADTATPCSDLLVQQHMVQGHLVGETDCQITGQSTVQDNKGRPFNRVDIALSGTAFGYADPNTQGNTRKDLTDAPNILFPQFGITSWQPGVGQYSGNGGAGAGLTVLYPAQGTPWNGKVFFAVHGQANNTPLGDLAPQQATGLSANTFDNLYADEMIDQGYAVIYTRRPASSGVPTTLDNGAKLDESLNDNVDTILSFLQTGQKLLQQKLGKPASATYWYGHSAGVILGRLVNYSGMNYDAQGHKYFDGFLDDDAGGGLPLPLSMQEGNVLGENGNVATFNPADEIYKTNADRAKFTKELNLSHDLYQSAHSWLPHVSYLDLKRQNTLLMQQEGLGDKTRMYEVAGVSHIAATSTSPAKTLDIGGLADASITLLDQWVQKNVAPPATMADLASVGGHNNKHQPTSVQLPPIACPTGVRFAGPPPAGSVTSTGYVPYDGTTLEPVNSDGVLTDVNGNGYRDAMPTLDQAWRSLGLIGKHDTVTKNVYVGCVKDSVHDLVQNRLLTQDVANWYIQQAQNFPNLPW
jgi:hypothetical protein